MKYKFTFILIFAALAISCNKDCFVTAMPTESYFSGKQYYNPEYFDSTYTWRRFYFVDNYKNNDECNEFLKNYAVSSDLDTTCKINTFVFLESNKKFQKILKSGDYNSMFDSKISGFERVVICINSKERYMTITYKWKLKLIKSETIEL